MSNLIYQIEKNGNEVVRFEVSEFKGKEYINIRIWYEAGNGEYKPTQKGVTLDLDKADELYKGMDRLKVFLADKAKSTNKKVSFRDALIIGVSQAIAILPGISRSGATISTSVLLGIDRERSARFSFLMVVPLILAKVGKDILSGEITMESSQLVPLSVGFAAAFITGLLACTWMIKLVKNSKLSWFAVYCIIVGSIAIGYTVLF